MEDKILRFQNMRFGMFIHFGLYSIPGGIWKDQPLNERSYNAEWILYNANYPSTEVPLDEYRQLTKQFHPEKFNAEEWVLEAKNAGMKYMVVTTKHHDGFALWDSKVSDFNVVKATPFKRDIIRELKDACDRHGLVLAAYYSHWQDWEHEGGGRPQWEGFPQQDDAAFEVYWNEKCIPQVKELLDYGIRQFWFDNWCPAPLLTPERLDKLIGTIRAYSPECLINSRIGTTWNHPQGDELVDYISMQDNQFPAERIKKAWETSGTFNHSWGFHRRDFRWKSTDYLLRCLINNASRNGNYQLNVGPLADGSFPKPCVRRLREIGGWFHANGEAICGTTYSELEEPSWGRLTQSRDQSVLYVHVLENDMNNDLRLPTQKPAKRVTILETGEEVKWSYKFNSIYLEMPRESFNTPLNVVKIEF